ncbi:hypothetical protein Llab_0487 [Lactococcus lactis]|nr:hypothetical protein Llab_0487 [Lactococcus lactis]
MEFKNILLTALFKFIFKNKKSVSKNLLKVTLYKLKVKFSKPNYSIL